MTGSKWINSIWVFVVLNLGVMTFCAGVLLKHGEFGWAAFSLLQAGWLALLLLRTLATIDHQKAIRDMFREHAEQLGDRLMADVTKVKTRPWN